MLKGVQSKRPRSAQPGRRRCAPHQRTRAHTGKFERIKSDSGLQTTVAYDEVTVVTGEGTSVHDITGDVRSFLTGVGDDAYGTLSVTSSHTTTAVCINEMEPRLVEDLRLWLHRQAPPGDMYLHNDLDRREAPEGWTGTSEEWRAQEPINAHSHLLSIMTGSSESIPVMHGKLMIGRWQSILLVELDGSRERRVALNFVGLAQ